MESTHYFKEMLELVFMGGFLAAIGQVVRELLCLAEMRLNAEWSFNLSRVVTSLAIAFSAGCLGVCIMAKSAAYKFSHEDMLMFLVLGYAVGDLGERILRIFAHRGSGALPTRKISPDILSDTEGNNTH